MNNSNNTPFVSVVIATKNEEKNIENCIKSIKNQTYPSDKIEMIVVDNNSSDKTVEIAKKFSEKVYTKGPKRSSQLNLGVKNANGKYIVYPDADMILSEKVIEECVKKCEKEDCIALYIPEVIIGKNFWIKVRNFERSFYDETCIDAVRFVSKDGFLGINGFDEEIDFGADDWDFNRLIKTQGKVDIINSPLYHNEGEFNLKAYLSKKGHYSQYLDKYIEKWGEGDLIIKKQFGAWYRLFGVYMEEGKWKRFISKPHLALGVSFLRFLVGLVFIINKIEISTKIYCNLRGHRYDW
ncbi:MAG: glycosyltransferase [Halobacteriota archaeon]|nr:glycosyltransferase [Halobacteriota archaeon]